MNALILLLAIASVPQAPPVQAPPVQVRKICNCPLGNGCAGDCDNCKCAQPVKAPGCPCKPGQSCDGKCAGCDCKTVTTQQQVCNGQSCRIVETTTYVKPDPVTVSVPVPVYQQPVPEQRLGFFRRLFR